jgi:site-specific DNA-methyltransferase (adenine-specific)
MSKARREEIEESSKKEEYIKRLVRAKIILPPINSIVAENIDYNYGVPWL